MQDSKKINSVSVDTQNISLSILTWMASEPDIMGRFLNLSGLHPNDLRNLINDPGFLAGLLDFIMNHEPDLLAFCEATGNNPEHVAQVWHKVSGPSMNC